MTALAPTLQSWFTDHLIGQRGASPNTVAAYRDCMRLLICYAHDRHGVQPAQLDLAHLDDRTVAGFLDMLEVQRHAGVATRNARLAAIHSLFSYASFRHPEHAEQIARVLAIPAKSTSRVNVTYLDDVEVEAILAAPDRGTWSGQRDHTWLLLMITTGIRVGELVSLRRLDVSTRRPAHIVVTGKGRKERIIPLDKPTASTLVQWAHRDAAPSDAPQFRARGRNGPMSTDAVAQRVALHATNASARAPSLKVKTVTPHALRHTCAMRMLASGLDITTIALWLGHASPAATRHYLHADLGLKQRALERTTPPHTKKGRYSPTDKLLAFLEAL
ncbi:MAG: tyrosine-type recombinase/integrase [Actinomycetota bacterium]|nr:tyrosine-type recombinase/integrase [Actinomycetota bacterium]MDA8354905.1 tyrosine-type recombinase/integrase [Actinomycetota bacterium]